MMRKSCKNCEFEGAEFCRLQQKQPCKHYAPTDKKREHDIIFYMIMLALFIFGMALASCKTVYTPVDVHDRDSVRVEIRVDTFYMYHYDSVRVQLPCSDSIEVAYVYKWTRDTIYKARYVHDTICVNNVDTIFQAVEVEKPVKYVPKYYSTMSWIAWILIGLILLIVGWKIYRKFV